jgi:hypothetical protein
MNSPMTLRRIVILPMLLAAIGFLTSCASTPKVDWTARMGEYTFDQAVAELGPPTKQAPLSDGKTVAEWVTRSPQSSSFGVGVGGYGGYGGMGMGSSFGGYRERILRLTFGADGKLENWYRNY